MCSCMHTAMLSSFVHFASSCDSFLARSLAVVCCLTHPYQPDTSGLRPLLPPIAPLLFATAPYPGRALRPYQRRKASPYHFGLPRSIHSASSSAHRRSSVSNLSLLQDRSITRKANLDSWSFSKEISSTAKHYTDKVKKDSRIN